MARNPLRGLQYFHEGLKVQCLKQQTEMFASGMSLPKHSEQSQGAFHHHIIRPGTIS